MSRRTIPPPFPASRVIRASQARGRRGRPGQLVYLGQREQPGCRQAGLASRAGRACRADRRGGTPGKPSLLVTFCARARLRPELGRVGASQDCRHDRLAGRLCSGRASVVTVVLLRLWFCCDRGSVATVPSGRTSAKRIPWHSSDLSAGSTFAPLNCVVHKSACRRNSRSYSVSRRRAVAQQGSPPGRSDRMPAGRRRREERPDYPGETDRPGRDHSGRDDSPGWDDRSGPGREAGWDDRVGARAARPVGMTVWARAARPVGMTVPARAATWAGMTVPPPTTVPVRAIVPPCEPLPH